MAFLRPAERLPAGGESVPIDHSILIASLAAQRQFQAPRRGVDRAKAGAREAALEEPLIELLLAGPAWRQAVAAQRGCFSRAEAGRRLNVS